MNKKQGTMNKDGGKRNQDGFFFHSNFLKKIKFPDR